MHLNMKSFLLTGQFGSVVFDLTRPELAGMLGEPDNWGSEADLNKAQIWRYGSFEFYFPKHGDGLHMIFSDHLQPFEGSRNLTLDPWILSDVLSLQNAETLLTGERIVYQRAELPELNASELIVSSGVVLRFDTVEQIDDRMFTAFWLKHSQPEYQRDATKQVSVTLPLHVYEKLREESLARRKTIASLCSELLVRHIHDLDKQK